MGTNGLFGTGQLAFQRDIYPKGIDFNGRTQVKSQLPYQVAAGTTIRAGQWVRLDANGLLVPVTLVTDKPIGIAAWFKQDLGVTVQVDFPVVVVASGTVSVGHPNIVDATFNLRTAKLGGGGALDGPVGHGAGGALDYAFNATLGTVTFTAGVPGTTNGATVYASYSWNMTLVEMNVDGTDFRNQRLDDVTGGGDRMSVIQDFLMITTTEFDMNGAVVAPVAFTTDGALGSAGNKLYLTVDGRVSTASAGGATFVGRVVKVPTATDPWLTYQSSGDPLAP